MVSLIDKLFTLAKAFDYAAFTAACSEIGGEERLPSIDEAMGRARAREARSVLLVRGIPLRERRPALSEVNSFLLQGYVIGRWMLGTFSSPTAYSQSRAEARANSKRLTHMAFSYEFDDLTAALRGPALDVLERLCCASGPISTSLGLRVGPGVCFCYLMHGLRLALAEEELFGPSRST